MSNRESLISSEKVCPPGDLLTGISKLRTRPNVVALYSRGSGTFFFFYLMAFVCVYMGSPFFFLRDWWFLFQSTHELMICLVYCGDLSGAISLFKLILLFFFHYEKCVRTALGIHNFFSSWKILVQLWVAITQAYKYFFYPRNWLVYNSVSIKCSNTR